MSGNPTGKGSDRQTTGNQHYENVSDPSNQQGFIAPGSGSVDHKSEARQQNETDLEPDRKAFTDRTADGDKDFKAQVDQQHSKAQSQGAASQAAAKEQLQADVFKSHTDAAANRAPE